MSFIEGRHTEYNFKNTVEKFGHTAVKATKDQNIRDHIDFIIDGKFSVDVKGLKRLTRNDLDVNEHYHYVEIKNVNGDVGWLYGKAKLIAFETLDYWIFVKRTDLVKHIEDTVDFSDFVYRAPKAYKKVYSRKGREDMITLVKTIDLCYINAKIIKK